MLLPLSDESHEQNQNKIIPESVCPNSMICFDLGVEMLLCQTRSQFEPVLQDVELSEVPVMAPGAGGCSVQARNNWDQERASCEILLDSKLWKTRPKKISNLIKTPIR